ncbi:protease SohB [Kangiella sediminilitoris]|uniref:protease SohB n=1 Tax=Kangiella sediminilitoris TaxID=1144748 RepID=UPI00083E3A8A
MEFLSEYGLFLLKAATIIIGIMLVLGMIINAGHRQQQAIPKGDLRVTNLGDAIKERSQAIKNEVMSKYQFKYSLKKEKEEDKAKEKEEKQKLKSLKKKDRKADDTDSKDDRRARVFVIDFDGDIEASDVESMREEITAILTAAEEGDEVMVRLKSPGGMVHTYGLAASQLQRVRDAGYKLTIAVDEVAASGGYMMACVADTITAAPFAVIGSIGVVAELPNFHRLLKKANVDYEQHTAGDYKRTLTMFGENTSHGRDKFKQDLDDTHELFKSFINKNRPQLDLEKVATGEHWYGTRAKELDLVDDLKTSDDLIIDALKDKDVYAIKYSIKKPISERLSVSFSRGAESLINRLLHRSSRQDLFK